MGQSGWTGYTWNNGSFPDPPEFIRWLHARGLRTVFRRTWKEKEWELHIEPVQGDISPIPRQRDYAIVFHGIRHTENVRVELNGAPKDAAVEYDAAAESLTVKGIVIDGADGLAVTLGSVSGSPLSKHDRTSETCLGMLRRFKLKSVIRERIANVLPQIVREPNLLNRFVPDLTGAQIDALRQTIDRRQTTAELPAVVCLPVRFDYTLSEVSRFLQPGDHCQSADGTSRRELYRCLHDRRDIRPGNRMKAKTRKEIACRFRQQIDQDNTALAREIERCPDKLLPEAVSAQRGRNRNRAQERVLAIHFQSCAAYDLVLLSHDKSGFEMQR